MFALGDIQTMKQCHNDSTYSVCCLEWRALCLLHKQDWPITYKISLYIKYMQVWLHLPTAQQSKEAPYGGVCATRHTGCTIAVCASMHGGLGEVGLTRCIPGLLLKIPLAYSECHLL